MPRPDACVIFNPAAGKHRAARRLEALQKSNPGRFTLLPTSTPGHAIELARQATLDGFAIVAAAGGDGTVHEVANGILLANRPDVQFGIIPVGSANDYAFSLDLADPAAPAVREVDVGVVRTSSGREKFFVCCLGVGFSGAVTLESRKIRWLQGVALYGLATLRALGKHFRCPTLEISFDDESPRSLPTLMLGVLLGRREGGFVMAPDALLDDGLFDYIHTGALSRSGVLGLLPRLALFGVPKGHPKIRQGRCRRVRLKSSEPLIAHVDGEFFSRPEEGVHEIEVRLLSKALRIRRMET